MPEVVIKVEGLSKRFLISHVHQERYSTLREALGARARNLLSRKTDAERKEKEEEFWALQDVNFEVKQGDRIGIIGRNGAGKSTLLKILSRITDPTRGKVTLDGRIASLLEVGTGFHPELTGRENIFLNGSILGMKRAEIRSKFDEIVAFAEVEKFLDTPVKRYSSGMYVRLAFAVAAHLEPEILIVDEVLAVGDIQFQKKCLGKMEEVSTNQGRTVLFVSHNMSTLKSLCSSILYLNQGRVISQGPVESIIKEYLDENKIAGGSGTIPKEYPRKFKTDEARFCAIGMTTMDGKSRNEFGFGEDFRISIKVEVLKKIEQVLVNVIICTVTGETVILTADTKDAVYQPRDFEPGQYEIEIANGFKLLPSTYSLTAIIAHYSNGTPIDWVENVYRFSVSGVGLKKGSDYPWGINHGTIEPPSQWSFTKL
jgi:lipopolysaccharide transport system ATP-binding protein